MPTSTESCTGQPPSVSIQSAAQLFAALRSPDPATRVGVLRAVAVDPERALRYGPHDGVGLPDQLISMVDTALDYPYWRDVAEALSRFRGPAVTAFFVRMLQTSTGPESSFPAAERLGLDDRVPLLPALRDVLMDDVHLHRVSAVASILRDDTGLDSRTKVRLAVADAQAPPAPLTAETVTWWLRELDGPYREPARTRLETQGAEAAQTLAANWDVLPPEHHAWAFGWIAAAAPDAARTLLDAILNPDTGNASAAIVAALTFIAGFDGLDPARRLADGWFTSADPDVCAAAAAASSELPHPDTVLAMARNTASSAEDGDGTPDTGLITVLIHQLGHHPTARPALTALLADQRWEIRSAARDALICGGH